MLRISNIKMSIEDDDEKLKEKVANILKISSKNFKSFKIHKKSLDAREKDNIKYVYSVNITCENENKYLKIKNVSFEQPFFYELKKYKKRPKDRPVVVGSGPAGLFAGLILAESGLCPIILERGKDVYNRKKDIEAFWEKGILDENSNVQFGEGGAGTFSDGKLTTGTKDKRIGKVIAELIECGAPSEIAYLSKPHIGTDKLIETVKNIRCKIINLGGEFRFSSKFIGFNEENNNITHITVENNSKTYDIETNDVIIALGHSARDTIEMLYNNNITIEPKAFAVGVRIEHTQKMINESQYGKKMYDSPFLGAADYKLNAHLSNGRGVYTFCMCPGGLVVGASSEKNMIVTNGMSYYARDLPNANSALLVSVKPDDFTNKFKDKYSISGIEFQRELERKAFILGGKNYSAPIQLVGDFLNNRQTKNFGDVIPSYKPNVVGCDFREIFDGFIYDSLKEGILELDKKLKGFASYDAVLTAVETRSSSPVTIKRDKETLESNIKGIYPCGEGAGHAGGIISAAVDGIRCAEKIIEKY